MNQIFWLGAGLLSGLLPTLAQAQPTLVTNEPRTVVEYFDAVHRKLPSAEGARMRVETQYRDSVSGTVRSYRIGGHQLEEASYDHVGKGILHGQRQVWYDTGQLHWRETADHGKRQGELLSYYPSGQLKRRDQYQQGKRTAGECFGPDGKPVPFYEFEMMPNPPGGMDGLMQHLGRNMRYPAAALRSRAQGKVLVRFVVDSLGQVGDIAVEQGLHPALDAEAVRVVSTLPRWQPGRQDGIPVQVVYRVPISFTIAGPAPRRPKRASEADF